MFPHITQAVCVKTGSSVAVPEPLPEGGVGGVMDQDLCVTDMLWGHHTSFCKQICQLGHKVFSGLV